MDGLKPGPIQLHQQGQAEVTDENWMAAARTAIQSRLQQYVSKEIRFNLMALIGNQTDQWKRKVDELEKEVEKAGGGAAQKAPPAATATPTPASADAMDTSESSASASVAGGSSVVASSPSSVSDPGRLMQLQDALADARKQLTEEALKMERWRVENLRRKHNYGTQGGDTGPERKESRERAELDLSTWAHGRLISAFCSCSCSSSSSSASLSLQFRSSSTSSVCWPRRAS